MSSPGERAPDDGGFRGAPDGRPGPASDPVDLPHVYNPYAGVSYPSSYPVPPPGAPPAGLGPGGPVAPPRRPGSLHLALALLLLATLPSLLSGLALALAAPQLVASVPESQLEPARAAGLDPAQIIRIGGFVLLGVALVFAVLAVLAWSGRRWARALVALLTVGFALMLVVALVATGGQGAGNVLVAAAPVALAAVGVALLFARGTRAWFGRRP